MSLVRGLRRVLEGNEGTDNLTDCTVNGFEESVGSRSVGGNGAGSNAGVRKHELEEMTGKFGTVVMDAASRVRIAGEPGVS